MDAISAPAALEQRLGVHFARPELLQLALTHRSHVAEFGGESNERLEFLGDSVLGLVVTDLLYRTYAALPEGDLAKVRASVVSAEALAEVAAELDLGAAVRLGRGEETSGGRAKRSILADTLEAVLGAVYLEHGLELARRLVTDLLHSRIEAAAVDPGTHDHKTRLQVLASQLGLGNPVYDVHDDGPDHAKVFAATVTVDGRPLGTGEGRAKKSAEQAAARAACALLSDPRNAPVPTTAGSSPAGSESPDA